MDSQTTRTRRVRKKTWTSLGALQRKPNDYEIVTHNMNHTMGPTPLEMGPEVHGNVWLRKYRDGIDLKIADWDSFRDPDRVTYDTYVRAQDEAESFVDNLLETYTAENSIDERLSGDALALLGRVLAPQRYLVHAQQMVSAYVQQLAPSSYVGNCAVFQASDQLRRVQRIAYRTRQLDNAHPASGFGSVERDLWENDPDWQPMRKALEQMLLVFEWDAAFVANNLVIGPVLDAVFVHHLSDALRRLDDPLDAMILENLYKDCRRHNRWSLALSSFAIESNPANRDTLRTLAGRWQGAADEIADAGARLVAAHVEGLDAGTLAASVRAQALRLQAEAGLHGDA